MNPMTARQATEHWMELDGLRVFHCGLASGPEGAAQPPLLLIHGISCCTGTWAPFVDELATRADAPAILVPDLPAHDRSQASPRPLGIDDHADWLIRFMDRLGVATVDIMGHSMGGQIAVELAGRAGRRVRRAVLLGSTLGARNVSTSRLAAGLLLDGLLERPTYNLLLTRVFWRMGIRRYLQTARAMQRHDAFVAAREVLCPSLVLQGSRDAIIPKRAGEALARSLAYGTYDVVPGAPHAAQYSDPPRTADRVLAFLR